MTERPAGQPGNEKSEDAYRTISEVAAELDLPQHVLRFWETRFPQVRPLKRAGGRRFYRPEDVALLRAVRVLLYDEGYTIKGVQRLLAEHGARQVADALARSRAAAGPAGEGRRDRITAAPERDRAVPAIPAVREPVPAIPAPARPGGIGPPAALPPYPAHPAHPAHLAHPVPTAPAADQADVAGRLSAVLADLAECARLLASLRAT